MSKPYNEKNPFCPLCFSNDERDYFYPPTEFNEKTFRYKECLSCGSSYVFPFPSKDDFDKIYGVNDHIYLKNLDEGEIVSTELNIPLYDYQYYQLLFFKKFSYWKNSKSLLDVGCGNGFYMKNAMNYGLAVTGIEYNAEFATLLKDKTGLPIFSMEDFTKNNSGKKFDLIHFGHILEHLPNPHEMLNWVKEFAHDETILIIDGPLEKNKSFARFVIATGSKIKNNKLNHYAPQHITFTNLKSQLDFFKINNLECVHFKTIEQMWPLPSTPDYKSPYNFFLFLVGKLSITFSKLVPKWGNVFHYAGKFKK